MEQQLNNTFNLKQREMFAKLLAQARVRVQDECADDFSANQKVETKVAAKLAEEYGAKELIEKIDTLNAELDEVESALHKIGFEYEDDRISIYFKAPKALDEALEAAKRAKENSRRTVMGKDL